MPEYNRQRERSESIKEGQEGRKRVTELIQVRKTERGGEEEEEKEEEAPYLPPQPLLCCRGEKQECLQENKGKVPA